ncbi:MAG: discoidin domain-containing protein [Planctomycetota bacterium]|jgi:hypothetical protein
MKRLVKNMVGILVILLASAAAQAGLGLVENFEGMSTTNSPDGQACTGVMGGTLDTQSEGTGNIDIVDADGSRVVTVIGHSSGNNARAFGFNGITNTIDNSETGIAFCRFWLRDTSRAPRTYIGLISDATDNPITGTNADNPMSIPVGFSWVDDGSGGLDIVTTDGAIVLKAGLARGQWYNVWIVANNAADTFDLYLSEAEGPAGEATLPTPEDLIESNIPFGVATTEPLTGMIFANPAGTGQAERIYIDEIYWDGDQGLGKPTKARNPIPANEESDVPRDVILGWTPGPFAAAHDVYFGTSFDDVYNGIGGFTQSVTSYAPAQRLDFGTTYYWRVDEIDAPPDSTVYRGSIWSFTTEPVAYPIENITANASSSDLDKGPENTVNGAGLDATGLLHGKEGDSMWLSSMIGPQPTWIEYEFDGVYKLYEMWVWNSNDSLEPAIGFGFKDVTIEYSVNGTDYTTLGTTHEFVRAPGLDDYAHNTTVDLNGATAKYVRLTANSNWGSILNQYGLSEVRFFYIPISAREPDPSSGARNVSIGTIDEPIDVILGFRAGREAARHDVYFSSDEQAVIDGTAPVATVTETSYGPLSLDLGMTYYWRIDEVNDTETPTTWKGDLWNFRTQEYFIVDDIESYNDINEGEEGSNRIYNAWVDGYNDPTNGSTVGHLDPPFYEETIVHGGGQSMPLYYDNAAGKSEAILTLTSNRDWTEKGVDTLAIWYIGDAANAAETMYVVLNGTAGIDNPDANAAQVLAWTEWTIDLQAFADQGVNLTNVNTITLGFGNRSNPTAGGSGMMFFDDIRLYPPAP